MRPGSTQSIFAPALMLLLFAALTVCASAPARADEVKPGMTFKDCAADCPEMIGDEIERVVAWKGGADVAKLAGKVVRLRFALRDADLYALRFR